MKKMIFTITILLYFFGTVQAGPFVKFEAGPSLNVDNVYFTEAIIGYKLRFFGIESQTYGGWLTWTEYLNGICTPVMNIYSFDQKIKYQGFFIHYKHYCAHPSLNKIKTFKDENGSEIYTEVQPSPYWWNGKISTISIGFEYEFR